MTLFRFPPSSFLLAASASAAKALNLQDAKEKGITVISATVNATAGPAIHLGTLSSGKTLARPLVQFSQPGWRRSHKQY
jgi:hypothetical protein